MTPFACELCGTSVAATAPCCPECDEPRPRGGWPLDPQIGRVVLQRFRLLRRLGSGTSSDVFAARDLSLGDGAENLVVVKLLVGNRSERARKRFLNEIRAIRSLHGAHIVKVYDAGMDEAIPCIVMEYLDGISLRRLLEDSPTEAREKATNICLSIADALVEAHEKGVVHRDIKPDNVFLCGPERVVKVLDFGAASFLGPEATHSTIGTPRYMAPEQIEQRAIDGRSDTYALGVTLFELLTGRPPFLGGVSEILVAHVERTPPKVRDFAPTVAPELDALVATMLAKTTDARPTMAEVRQRLRDLQGARALAQTRAGGNKAWLAVALLGLASVGVGLRAWGRSSDEVRSEVAPERTEPERKIPQDDAKPALLQAVAQREANAAPVPDKAASAVPPSLRSAIAVPPSLRSAIAVPPSLRSASAVPPASAHTTPSAASSPPAPASEGSSPGRSGPLRREDFGL